MTAAQSQLDQLRRYLHVDCDTLDSQVAATLGPFDDATSNQVIAAAELAKPGHADLINSSMQQARRLFMPATHECTIEDLAVDIMTINLQAATISYLTSNIHIQTNPYQAHSTSGTIAHAKRISTLLTTLHPTIPRTRLCLKIPSTHAGLQACAHLSAQGFKTLATILFTLPQAILASRSGCTYIAPYINRLRVHFPPHYIDPDPGFAIVHAARLYYDRTRSATQIMPASLTSVADVRRAAGWAHRITVSPGLLADMAGAKAEAETEIVRVEENGASELAEKDWEDKIASQDAFDRALRESKGGEDQRKFDEALDYFCKAQGELVELARKALTGEVVQDGEAASQGLKEFRDVGA